MPFDLFALVSFLVIGLISGFIASAPPGPVNLYLTQILLEKGKKATDKFIWGVILADLVYVVLGLSAYFFWSKNEWFNWGKPQEILAGLVIMGVGLWSLWKNQKKLEESNSSKKSTSSFWLGILICGSNSLLFVLWFFIASIYDEYGFAIQNNYQFSFALLGIFMGDLVWFYGYSYLAQKGLAFLKNTHLQKMQTLIAISLILFGLFTACR